MPHPRSQERSTCEAGVLRNAPVLAGIPPFASKLLPLQRAHDLYERARRWDAEFILEGLLYEMKVQVTIDSADAERIPKKGATVVVANHPYGLLDGAVLSVLLSRVRPDVKVMTNFLLEGVPELEKKCIFVDPLHTPSSQERNRRALKQAIGWLKRGNMLAIFPAGEVSHWQFQQGGVADPHWNNTAARLIQSTGASALPVYFCGQNSLRFQIAGLLHPRLRLAFLLQEFLQQSGKEVALRVGSPIPASTFVEWNDTRATEYLRWRTYLLAERGRTRIAFPNPLRSMLPAKAETAIPSSLPRELLTADLSALPEEQCLVETAEFSVHAARAEQIPHLLHEVGRLRELTFRAVGEGSGKPLDLDRFDDYYWHLLLWHKQKQELVGAYRAACTPDVIAEHGLEGLYTSTLFQYDPRLFERTGPALELGRSFVRAEYQRQYAPLLLLWKAIARFVARRPETPVLFGAVSISNAYNYASRCLIYSYFESRRHDEELAGLIRPRRPFRPVRLRHLDRRALGTALRDVDELSEPIADLEMDGKGLPVLLKQYAKVGGRLLGFNVDKKFSDVLDGLIVVDLRDTDRTVLERYMGREGLQCFCEHHGLS